MGHVVQAGCGQAPARQAALFAGLEEKTPCTTINKVCGSGLKTIISATQTIKAEDAKIVIAGGMENMSQAPHLIHQSRTGSKFGHNELKDSLLLDGLWDVYSDRPMGNCAEECTKKYEFTREAQDEYAIRSFKRAQASLKENLFANEITPVSVKNRKETIEITEDEGPFKAKFDKIPKLRPAFDKEGTITAANASTINDGAAAIVLGDSSFKDQADFKIISYASHAQNPTWFTTAPVEAMKKACEKGKVSIDQIDYFEVNEAFAAVPMAVQKELNIADEKLNIYGGGVSLGHPIGCSGTRIVVTLMNILKQKKARYGMASICIGGGEGLALIIENIKL